VCIRLAGSARKLVVVLLRRVDPSFFKNPCISVSLRTQPLPRLRRVYNRERKSVNTIYQV
ncbi:MAG: hypothetical protein AAGJ93_08600, partial [Bacteroidota bacterium]